MGKRFLSILSVLVIFAFIAYMIWDSVRVERPSQSTGTDKDSAIAEMWQVSSETKISQGNLNSVCVSQSGIVYVGGSSFVSSYDESMKLLWTVSVEHPVTAVACSGDSVFAALTDLILVISKDGKQLNEFGPYEKNAIITSLAAGRDFIAIADAGNRTIYLIDKGGEVKKMIGRNDNQFVIPSAYFDVSFNANNELYAANTGHRRIERRSVEGSLEEYFGEPGTAANAFCGCCNPAHFTSIPGGFVTAEKGINRIKILNSKGEFVEFVTARNDFTPSVPLDIASADGKKIYAANPANSTLYIYTRKNGNQ